MGDRNLGNALTLLQGFIKEAQKSEMMAKRATDPSEPTSHPVMGCDDGTRPMHAGAAGTEFTADIRKAYGESGVTGQEDAGSAPNNSEKQIGEMKPMASDTMGGNTSTPKKIKDAPEDKGPGDETFSEKYSEVAGVGNRLLGSLSALMQIQKEAAMPPHLAAALAKKRGTKPAEKPEKGETVAHEEAESKKEAELQEKLAAAEQYPDDAAAGYMAAQSLLQDLQQGEMLQKAAADQFEGIVKTAQDDAVLYASFVDGLQRGALHANEVQANLQKQAEGIPTEEGPDVGGALPPDAGGDAGGGLPPELAAQLAAGGGGEDEGAPPDDGGGDAGGGGDEGIIDQLAEALDQAGVTPEELAQALAEHESGGGGADEGVPKMASAKVKMARALKSLVA